MLLFFQAVQFQISVLPWKLLLTFFAQTKISRLMFPISADTNADEEQSYHLKTDVSHNW